MKKKPVTERALLGRINRLLAKQGEQVRTCRKSSKGLPDLGRFYCVDYYKNLVTHKNLDLEAWGRELNVLGPDETLTDQ